MPQVTMKEIAKKCGVSQPTVSRILNDKASMVTEEKRELVLETARKLNYRPNYFAKSLKQGKTQCIGLMGSLSVPNFNFNYFSDTVAAVENGMFKEKTEQSLLIFGTDDRHSHQRTVDLVQKGMVDGLIIILLSIDFEAFEQNVQPALEASHVPFVVLHSTTRKFSCHNVGVDSAKGGYLAAEHLIKLGHKTIHCYHRENSPQGLEILDGFKKGMAAHDLAFTEGHMIHHKYHNSKPYESAGLTIRDLPAVPRAIFASNDDLAYGIIKACKERGVRVPEDTAIVGFNDEKPAEYFKTDLTTIHHPIEEKGATAVKMLLDLLDGKRDKGKVQREILEPYLVVRKTCGSDKPVGS